MKLLLLLWGCATGNTPAIVAHRALGVAEGSDAENLPENVLLAFEAGYGAEVDLRLDGDGCGGDPTLAETTGCFDLGHRVPNGYTLVDAVDALEAGWRPEFAENTWSLDLANDPDRQVSRALVPWLRTRLAESPVSAVPLLIQSSSLDNLVIVRESLDDDPTDFLDIRLGITYFADPEFTVPDYVDVVVTNVVELPSAPLPVPVAVFGVSTTETWKQSVTATSDVKWVITDYPSRIEALQ